MLEIPVIGSAEYKLPIIREIYICMFSLYIKMKFKKKIIIIIIIGNCCCSYARDVPSLYQLVFGEGYSWCLFVDRSSCSGHFKSERHLQLHVDTSELFGRQHNTHGFGFHLKRSHLCLRNL